MKQTAVNSLIEQLLPLIDRSEISDTALQNIIEGHLAMEKEQIMDANSCGFSDGINHEKDIPVNFISCEQYYNETFKNGL